MVSSSTTHTNRKVSFNCLKHGQWPVLLLSPALCLITSIRAIKKGDVRACWAIPFVMGLIAYLFPPFADFARTENDILELLDLPLSAVIALRGDLVLTAIEYFFLKNGIPIEFFRFLYTFIGYFFITKIVVDITKKQSLSSYTFFYVWLFLFFQVEFFGYIDNIRTIFVRLVLLYCMYQYFFNNLERYRYYSLLLIPVHFAYFPILLLFFISKYIIINFSRKIRILVVAGLFFGWVLSDYINVPALFSGINFGDAINKRILVYTEGEWSSDGESSNSLSFAYKIYTSLASLGSYYIMFVFCKAKYNFNIERFSILLGIVCLMTLSIPVLFGRYIGFFHLTIILFVLYGYCNGLIKQKQMKVYLALCMFKMLLDIYAYWNCIVNGNLFYVFLPLPLALFQTYNFAEWRDHHLADDFDKIVNGGILSR